MCSALPGMVMTLDRLIQLTYVIELLESPQHAHIRIQLLFEDENALYLKKTLVGLLELLPESEA